MRACVIVCFMLEVAIWILPMHIPHLDYGASSNLKIEDSDLEKIEDSLEKETNDGFIAKSF